MCNEATHSDSTIPSGDDRLFWFSLIDERQAAAFLGLSVRHVQGLRYRGGGPRYVRLSSRCVRYRRIDLREWAEAHLQLSTSEDPSRAGGMGEHER